MKVTIGEKNKFSTCLIHYILRSLKGSLAYPLTNEEIDKRCEMPPQHIYIC